MGKPKQFDWTLAKALFINGMCHKDIALKLVCSIWTVRDRSQKEAWGKGRDTTTQIHAQLGDDDAVNRWLKGIEQLLERVTQNSLSLGSAKSRKDLKDDADTLRTLISAGRQHFGLDNESTSLRIGIQVGRGGTRLALVGSGDCQLAMQVVDAESSGDDGKALGVEGGGEITLKETLPEQQAGDEPPLTPLSAS